MLFGTQFALQSGQHGPCPKWKTIFLTEITKADHQLSETFYFVKISYILAELWIFFYFVWYFLSKKGHSQVKQLYAITFDFSKIAYTAFHGPLQRHLEFHQSKKNSNHKTQSSFVSLYIFYRNKCINWCKCINYISKVQSRLNKQLMLVIVLFLVVHYATVFQLSV